MRQLRFVLFDAGGTLIGPSASEPIEELLTSRDHRATGTRRRAKRILRDAIVQHRELVVRRRSRSSDPDIAGELWREAFMRATDDPELAAELLRLFLSGRLDRPYSEVHLTLRALRARGFRLAVVSNFSEELPKLLERHGLRPFFESLVVSACVGVTKPDPVLFNIALDRLSAQPEEALYVGDNPEVDLAGAEAIGMAAVLVDRDGLFTGEFPNIVRDLSGLLELSCLCGPPGNPPDG